MGSIYCVDWSRTERLIASGSNDRLIKLLVVPNLHEGNHQILELTLSGHQAIVRTVCFNPTDDLQLLSGGQTDKDVKVWNSETGQQVASLKGHTGDINSIKMAADGSYAVSVGTDRKILIFDIRCQRAVGSMDSTGMSEMHEVSLSNHPQTGLLESTVQNMSSVGGSSHARHPLGLAAVAHQDGSVSLWNLHQR